MGCVRETELLWSVWMSISLQKRCTHESINSNWQSQDKVKDEQPSPSRHATFTVHAREKSSLQISREHLSNDSAHDKQAASTRQLALSIPRAEAVHDTWPSRRLKQADEEAQDVKLVRVVALEQG